MNAHNLTNLKTAFTLTVRERHLIEELRKVPFGMVEIAMRDSQPERIVTIRESKKL